MWTEEQTKAQLARSQASLDAVLARVKSYDSEMAKLNELRSQEMQEALRLNGEVRILTKQIEGDAK